VRKLPDVVWKFPDVVWKLPDVVWKFPDAVRKLPDAVRKLHDVVWKLQGHSINSDGVSVNLSFLIKDKFLEVILPSASADWLINYKILIGFSHIKENKDYKQNNGAKAFLFGLIFSSVG